MKEKMIEKMKEKMIEMFTGELTISKREFWMIVTICSLLGVLIGLIKAPLTHGLIIGCGNGNNSGNNCKDEEALKEEAEGKR